MAKKKYEITPENMEKLATDLIDYFSAQDLFFDMCIFVNHQAWSSDKSTKTETYEQKETSKGNTYYVRHNIEPETYVKYNNPKTITITFEGPLYGLINYKDYDFIYKLTNKFLDKYGLYFEQGYAWSMAAYE